MDIDYLIHPRPVGSVSLDTTAGAVAHPATVELGRYWRSIVGADGLAHRAALNPMRIPHLLPQLFIAEPDGEEWRFRLLGTDFCRRLGRDVTGLTVREVFGPKVADSAGADYRAVIETGTPKALRIRYIDAEKPDAEADAIYLPLRGQNSMMILGGVFFIDTEYRREPLARLARL